jgi:hypothetical protein
MNRRINTNGVILELQMEIGDDGRPRLVSLYSVVVDEEVARALAAPLPSFHAEQVVPTDDPGEYQRDTYDPFRDDFEIA